MKITVALLAVAALCALPAGARADPPDGKVPTLAGLDLGEHWFGPEITKDDLVGKVVLFEIWGS